jgi:hypothetical protein
MRSADFEGLILYSLEGGIQLFDGPKMSSQVIPGKSVDADPVPNCSPTNAASDDQSELLCSNSFALVLEP